MQPLFKIFLDLSLFPRLVLNGGFCSLLAKTTYHLAAEDFKSFLHWWANSIILLHVMPGQLDHTVLLT
jgi:hypothetical protein